MVIIAINIIFLAVVIFVVYKSVQIVKRLVLKLQKDSDEQWGHTKRRYDDYPERA